MKALLLYPAEQKSFATLPEEFRKEFSVALETLDVKDSPEKMSTRLSLARLHDPKVKAFRDALQKGGDFRSLLRTLSLSSLNESDLLELCFALGPVMLTSVIATALPRIETGEQLVSLAALIDIRHTLLVSFQQHA